jgi:dynein heavy chain
VKQSLKKLLKALKGIVVMSGEVEQMTDAPYDNMVLTLWENAGYHSIKHLNFRMTALKERISFFANWVEDDPPPGSGVMISSYNKSFNNIKQNSIWKQRIGINIIFLDLKLL